MEEINKREKRGLINMVGHVQKTLFGTLDDEDGETYNTQIRELQNSRVGMLKIIDKQTSKLKLTNSAFKDAQGMEIQLKSLNITCKNLETSLKRVWDQIDLLEIRTTITNLITTLLLLLQQLVFETDMVGEIIFAAQNGIIHSGIISTRELRMQLRDILISLPGQLKLPFDVNAISLYELSKTSKLAIVYMNVTLVFELIIPLLNPVELTLYHMIPLPVRREKLYMHLTPEFEYMAISKIHEYYLTISVTHLMKCRELTSITMCPETQPLRIGSAGLPCEVELFMKPTVVPATCTVKYLELTRSIYHKLKYHNKWIYIINTLDDVAVTCDQSDNAKNIQLRGVGILTLSEQCRAHTPQVVLTPSRHLKSVQYLDFIPPVNIPNVKIPLVPSFKFDNLLNHQTSIIKLNHISDFSKTIEELENAVQDEKNRSILQTTSGNTALRGNECKEYSEENFLRLVNLLAEFDPVLQTLLNNKENHIKYLSPTIQNELIGILASSLQEIICDEIRQCSCFAIIMDSTRDITKIEQVTVIIRYVLVDFENHLVKIKESFLGFFEIHHQGDVDYKNLISQLLHNLGFDINKCKGQGYDGATVMSGIYSGLQKRINDIVPNVIALRWALLALGEDNATAVRKKVLKKVCATRWEARHNAVFALKERIVDVLKTLTVISLTSKKNEEIVQSKSLQKKIENI
ncbi:hypothetical protein QTP88_001322 [Uroleucon formosanum]